MNYYICANPRAGQREEMLNDYNIEFRYMVRRNYKIVYWIEPERVMIATVFDCRRNPERLLEEVTK